MSYEIELYLPQRTDMERFGTIPLNSVLRISGSARGCPVPHATIALLLLRVPDDPPPPGTPTLTNLLPEYGFARLIVEEQGRVIYRHPHPLEELIVQPLRTLLQESYPGEPHWAFCLVGPGVPKRGTFRPAPPVEGVVPVTPYQEGEAGFPHSA